MGISALCCPSVFSPTQHFTGGLDPRSDASRLHAAAARLKYLSVSLSLTVVMTCEVGNLITPVSKGEPAKAPLLAYLLLCTWPSHIYSTPRRRILFNTICFLCAKRDGESHWCHPMKVNLIHNLLQCENISHSDHSEPHFWLKVNKRHLLSVVNYFRVKSISLVCLHQLE